MTTNPPPTPGPEPVDETADLAQAIDALTRAARATALGAIGDEGLDVAAMVARVVTTVAANVGGVDWLLAGRPNTWEADLVRQLVHGTTGDDEDALVGWRTAPVRLVLDVERVLQDMGLFALMEEAGEELAREIEAAEAAMIAACASEDERARFAELEATMPAINAPDPVDRARWVKQMTEAGQLVKTIADRATAAGHPTAAAYARACATSDAVHDLWEADKAAYATAYLAEARAYLDEHHATCTVELVDYDRTTYRHDPLAETIDELARAMTILPMTGQRPDWTTGTPADAVRAAARTYLDRARAQQQ